jgi:predicted phage-related endonuclease
LIDYQRKCNFGERRRAAGSGVSDEIRIARRYCIGRSDANILLSDDLDRIERLWLQKRGEIDGDDLSDVLLVQLGVQTELLNTDWFKLHTGFRVANEQDWPTYAPWPIAQSTLDGLVYASDSAFQSGQAPLGVFEAKYQNPFGWSMSAAVKKYEWQLCHNVMVTGSLTAWLSVITGAGQYAYQKVDADPFAQAALLEIEQEFWACVVDGRYPRIPSLADAVIPDAAVVGKEGNESWIGLAWQYIDTYDSNMIHDSARRGIKKLVSPDARLAQGHGITVTRSVKGRITLEIRPGSA